ncbi:MAG: CBS domain-containing protein [Nocardioidaceae bacterium]
MWVREAMTSPVVTVTEDMSVRAALKLLDRHRVTSLPVVDDAGRVVGIVSEADLVRDAILRDQRKRIIPQDVTDTPPPRRVGDVMTAHPVTVTGTDDLADAVELLTTTTVKSLPVLEEGHVVGVLSRRDVVHLLAREDERIEADVVELFRAEDVDWLVDVDEGVVRISGPADEPERRLAQALAGSVTGVVAVRVD